MSAGRSSKHVRLWAVLERWFVVVLFRFCIVQVSHGCPPSFYLSVCLSVCLCLSLPLYLFALTTTVSDVCFVSKTCRIVTQAISGTMDELAHIIQGTQVSSYRLAVARRLFSQWQLIPTPHPTPELGDKRRSRRA